MEPWVDFSRKLFESEDSDPGYMLLARVDVPEAQRKRLMTAWVSFYNLGIAARASEYKGKAFWAYLSYIYPTAKRATERRHFRGSAGLRALDQWSKAYPAPERMVDALTGRTYFDVRRAAKNVAQIGGYFVWKFADVQERVFRIPCDFTGAEKYSPELPKQGAKLIGDSILPGYSIERTYATIVNSMNVAGMKSPPWYDRPMNMQEAETVCCVYKQWKNGSWCDRSRTAKATKRLLAEPCNTSDAMLAVFHPTYTKKEMAEWAETVLSAL